MNVLNFITLDDNSDSFLTDDNGPGGIIVVPFMSFHINRLFEQSLPKHKLPIVIARRQMDQTMEPGDIAMTERIDGVTIYSVGISTEMTDDDVGSLAETLLSVSGDSKGATWCACTESEEVPGARGVIDRLKATLSLVEMTWSDFKDKMKELREAA